MFSARCLVLAVCLVETVTFWLFCWLFGLFIFAVVVVFDGLHVQEIVLL